MNLTTPIDVDGDSTNETTVEEAIADLAGSSSDDQVIDALSISGGTVSISLEDDAQPAQTLGLISTDANNDITAGADGALFLNETDDQEADEVDLATNVDLDQDGTDETNVQEALDALALMPKIYATGKVVISYGSPNTIDGTNSNLFGASVTRLNEGDYQVTFDTALSNANYIIQVATIDCGGDCPGNSSANYDDPGITYYNQATTGFRVNIGDSDNGTTQKDDIDLEFMFTVIVIP